MDQDAEITLCLPQRLFNVLLQHLYAGRYADVAETVQLVTKQATPQLTELAKIAEAEAAVVSAARTN